jgi:hypothetical protein
MAAFVQYEIFPRDLGLKVHDLNADTLKIALTNTAPNIGTHEVRADISEIATGGGYTQNGAGNDIQNAFTENPAGTGELTGVDLVFTATTGFGPFRYAVLYNDTPTSPADPLIGYWDYGSSISLGAGETFTVDFGANILTITRV